MAATRLATFTSGHQCQSSSHPEDLEYMNLDFALKHPTESDYFLNGTIHVVSRRASKPPLSGRTSSNPIAFKVCAAWTALASPGQAQKVTINCALGTCSNCSPTLLTLRTKAPGKTPVSSINVWLRKSMT